MKIEIELKDAELVDILTQGIKSRINHRLHDFGGAVEKQLAAVTEAEIKKSDFVKDAIQQEITKSIATVVAPVVEKELAKLTKQIMVQFAKGG